ncbi:MAG: type II toxin-antitoxin system death-on-curing family toxin [Patescibacteria group bacterium]
MIWDEPIPNFGLRFPNILESCLKQPFIKFSKKDMYRGLVAKATTLFYLMIKNHPFQNGNKRIAVMSLLYFLSKNGKWLTISNQNLYVITLGIAKSKAVSHRKSIKNIGIVISRYLVDYPKLK